MPINAVDITAEVNQWLLAAFNSVIELLKDNRALLNKLAYALVERVVLHAAKIDELCAQHELIELMLAS